MKVLRFFFALATLTADAQHDLHARKTLRAPRASLASAATRSPLHRFPRHKACRITSQTESSSSPSTTASAWPFRTTPTSASTARKLNLRKTIFIALTDHSIRWSHPAFPTTGPSRPPSRKFRELQFSTPSVKRRHSVTRKPSRPAPTSKHPLTPTNYPPTTRSASSIPPSPAISNSLSPSRSSATLASFPIAPPF